jgi:hypothetical protein
MYYVKFDKDTGRINGLTNMPPKGDNFCEVDEEMYVKFAEDKSLRDRHVVKYSVAEKKYKLLPYVQPKVSYDIKDIIHHVPTTGNADCLITKNNSSWQVTMGNTDILLEPNRLCRFSVTHKRDLHMLIRTFEATVEEITNGHTVQFIDEEEKGDVSIYTPMVFDSYGLKHGTV